MTSTLGSPFTTTVRVIVRVHRGTANVWSPTLPTITTGFTDSNRVVFRITHLSDGCSTLTWHTANFAAR
jgi:hypothetical protein